MIELRASNAHRWMACVGQPKAVQGMEDAPGSAADRGTVAHALLEVMLRLDIPTDEIDRFADKPLLATINGRAADNIIVDEEMMNGVSHALDYVRGYLATHKKAEYFIECALDASPFIGYESGGTADVMLCNFPRELVVVDYKNGVQHIDHTDNEQLHIYALGAINKYSQQITPQTKIRMVIVQPNSRKRDGPVREVVYTYDDLMQFAKRAALAATAAHSKNPPRTAGTHCTFCRAAGTCRTYADKALGGAKLDFTDLTKEPIPMQDPLSMTTKQMATILTASSLLRRWLESVEQEAVRKLLADEAIPGYKLVGSNPHRKWTDADKIVLMVTGVAEINPGLLDELAPRIPLSPSRMEQRLGRKRDGLPTLLGRFRKYVARNPVEPRIAPEDDNRPLYTPGQEFIDG